MTTFWGVCVRCSHDWCRYASANVAKGSEPRGAGTRNRFDHHGIGAGSPASGQAAKQVWWTHTPMPTLRPLAQLG